MKLIKLQTDSGNNIWVNPNAVCEIMEWCRISRLVVGRTEYLIEMPPEELVKLLVDSENT